MDEGRKTVRANSQGYPHRYYICASLYEVPFEVLDRLDLSEKDYERGVITPEIAEQLNNSGQK